ncbi:hypothetical protein EJP67_18640 [Variovorax guangxiensis]|uniref:Uncharacterized protein n=1 Tax=Variovorax guangxiensis TaxID=1775474 RepID=A0A433MLW2_9BURK|nr:hypothetical protein [Variovorax guangxiensis]RUR69079.1 hypothetical protein EJP67_18640 [Variovorax guangxiensis]
MTVSATTRKAGPYAGNGVGTIFTFSFKVFAKADVAVVLTDSNGVATTLVLDSDYSVLLNADQDSNPGGSITYPALVGPAPLPIGSTLTMIGGLPYDQNTDITNAGRFLPQVIEDALDKVTILTQQLKEITSRTLQAAVGTTVSLIFPAPSSGKFIKWRSDLLGLENADAGTDSMVLQGLLADAVDPLHGSQMVGTRVPGIGAVGRNVSTKLADSVSVLDFGAVGDGVTNDKSKFDSAMVGRSGQPVTMPGDRAFLLASTLANNGTLSWPRGFYSNTTNTDPLDWSKLRPAQAMTWGSGGRANLMVLNSNFGEHELYNAVYPGVIHFSNLSSVAEIAPGSTIYHTAAITGAIKASAPASGINGNGVALYGLGTAEVNNAALWGVNTLLQDSSTRVAGTGTGRVLTGAEFDFNIMNPGTQVIGVSVGGNSLSQPTNANAFLVNTLSQALGFRWTTGFFSLDGCANNALAVGALNTSGVNVPSQQILFSHFDNAGVKRPATFALYPGGASAPDDAYLVINGTTRVSLSITNGDLLLNSGRHVVIDGATVLSNRVSGWGLPTGTLNRGTFDQSSVTLPQLAQRVAALITDLYNGHGLIGV